MAPLLLLLGVATGHALPALLNPADLHSDAAVVGLQARHLLQGEWSWFLWGSGYQTSTDALIAALLFRVLQPTPLALMLSSFLGHLLLVSFAFGTLRRHFDGWSSALLVTPLVMTTGPLHTYMLSPPRQASLTLVFCAIWLLDGAAGWRHSATAILAGMFVAGLSSFADPYALLFLPGFALFVALSVGLWPKAQRARSALAALFGALLGLLPTWLITHSAQASRGVLGLHWDVVNHNLELLRQTCLPYLLGTTAYYSPRMPLVEPWPAPAWFRAVQLLGSGLFLLGIAVGGASVFWRALPPKIRRLAALGAVMLPITLGAFALSVMVMDRLSARYLVAIVLMAPFALAPLLLILGRRRCALLLSPFLASVAVAGWLNYGDDVAGSHIVLHRESASDEALLARQLRDHGLRYGLADYWVAYRLTFLLEEQTIIVPWHEKLDRYAPYRSAVATQTHLAYIYDPWRSKESLEEREAEIKARETEFSPRFEILKAGRYTVLLLQRTHEIDRRVAEHGQANEPG
jgi:hypothetical protein